MLISKLYLYLKSYGVWVLIAAGLLILPLIFKNGSLLNLLSQMGIWIVFALSYNILLGQAGLFSFGHSVYSGLGAFATIYVLQGLVAGVATSILPFSIPVCLLPLVGGCVGAFFGIVFGAVSTQKSGTPFAMITLGIVELVSTSVLMLPQFFGGESGLSSNRVLQTDVMAVMFGIDLSTSLQLYYLIAVWCFVCMVAMFALTHTPLGRLANALRDNPERLEFIGYNSQWVRFLMVVIAGFFAGISGGLGALNFEIATIENVSAMRSGDVLLATVLG
jgi:branched-chain amino acid transport system permease protein